MNMTDFSKELEKVKDLPLAGYVAEIKRLESERDELVSAVKWAASRLSELGCPSTMLFDLIYKIEGRSNVSQESQTNDTPSSAASDDTKSADEAADNYANGHFRIDVYGDYNSIKNHFLAGAAWARGRAKIEGRSNVSQESQKADTQSADESADAYIKSHPFTAAGYYKHEVDLIQSAYRDAYLAGWASRRRQS